MKINPKMCRHILGLSQREMAVLAGVQIRALQKWESKGDAPTKQAQIISALLFINSRGLLNDFREYLSEIRSS